jgi:hypothetical protein
VRAAEHAGRHETAVDPTRTGELDAPNLTALRVLRVRRRFVVVSPDQPFARLHVVPPGCCLLLRSRRFSLVPDRS